MIEDITEVKRTQEEALARQKLESLGVLAGGIAHDFNNLLGGILAEAELAETDLAAGLAPSEEIQRIKLVAIRGAEIVRELMIFAGQDRSALVEAGGCVAIGRRNFGTASDLDLETCSIEDGPWRQPSRCAWQCRKDPTGGDEPGHQCIGGDRREGRDH